MPVILANMTADAMPPLPEGLLIELATPLTPTGTLDQGSLVRLLDRVAPVGGSPGSR